MSVHHSFDIDLATKYGIEEAILIVHFQRSIQDNARQGINRVEGRTWTYQTRDQICAIFPYLTPYSVRRACESLKSKGVIITANHNRIKLDKTLWYAFADEKAFNIDSKNCHMEAREAKAPPGKRLRRSNTKIALPSVNLRMASPYRSSSSSSSSKKNYEEERKGGVEGGVGEDPRPSASPSPALFSFGRFVKLEKAAFEELVARHGKPLVDDMIDRINDYLAATGRKPYCDYAAAIRIWIRREASFGRPAKAPVQAEVHQNKQIADLIEAELRKTNSSISVYANSEAIAFYTSPNDRGFALRYSEYGFKEQISNYLNKRNLHVAGVS